MADPVILRGVVGGGEKPSSRWSSSASLLLSFSLPVLCGSSEQDVFDMDVAAEARDYTKTPTPSLYLLAPEK